MAHTKRGAAAWLLLLGVLGVIAVAAAYLIRDRTEANLELAPIFFAAALAVASIRVFRPRARSRSGTGRY